MTSPPCGEVGRAERGRVGVMYLLLHLDRANGEYAVERSRHAAALDLFDVPVVGKAGPAQDRLDRRDPDVTRLDRLDAAQREHVREVHIQNWSSSTCSHACVC